ncbi:amidase [Acidisoma silvae]|uniref:Amidase n=1 Tax=Acidisoma silvae TaxID=2802396 RepID=A0A964E0F1_9PROT|nr:amidase [Acidisoma silvae]MCB8877276.1 amidase [Acidisoma silvae]
MTLSDMPTTIAQSASALRDGRLTSVQLVSALQTRAAAIDPRLGAFTTQYIDHALAAAAIADRELAAGQDRGPLHGIPLAVKDIVAAKEGPTTASSAVVDPSWWQGQDAPVVARLRAAGAIILGKTTTMEYALGEPDSDQALAQPRCAWDLGRWAGGSSSGSGSGVAAGLMLGAVGTDTGGSVRLPAAFNGITGHKPTFGLVPKSGVHVLGFSLDAVGPMARTARDCALMLDVMAGHDASDASSARVAGGGYAKGLDTPVNLTGLRIGVDLAAVAGRVGCDPATFGVFEAALRVFTDAGAILVPYVAPEWRLCALSAAVVWQVDALTYHHDLLRERWSEFGRGIRAQFIEGMLVTPSDMKAADRVRRQICAHMAQVLDGVDIVMSPTHGTAALLYDERSGSGVDETAFTSLWNLTGGPAISLPMGVTGEGLPLGLQIAGRAFDDGQVLAIADAFQAMTAHHRAMPPIARGEMLS